MDEVEKQREQREQTRLRVQRYREKQAALPKVFKDLPEDVQRSIETMSDTPEEKAQRTAIAIDYQKNQSKRPGTGIDCRAVKNSARPGDEDYQASGVIEHCGCGAELPQLEQPREYPGKCMPCVLAR